MASQTAVPQKIHFSPKEFLMTLFGSILFAGGINLFIVPCGIFNGGVLGISQLIYTFLQPVIPEIENVPFVSLVYYALNIPLFALAFFKIGRNFFVRTVFCVTAETIFLATLPVPGEMLVDSTLTSTIIGGLIAGAGSGIIFLARSSAGGLDVIGMYLTLRFKSLSVGKISLCVNAVIYAICALSIDISVAIFSVIYSAVSSLVIDKIHAQNICTEMIIFTKKDPDVILNYITETLGRSATFWNGTSGYSREESNIVFTVISKYEANRLEIFLSEYDPHIFAIKKHGVAIDGNFQKKL